MILTRRPPAPHNTRNNPKSNHLERKAHISPFLFTHYTLQSPASLTLETRAPQRQNERETPSNRYVNKQTKTNKFQLRASIQKRKKPRKEKRKKKKQTHRLCVLRYETNPRTPKPTFGLRDFVCAVYASLIQDL